MTTLAEVSARHAAAGAPVEEHRIAWPALRDTLRVIRQLRAGVTSEGGSSDLEALLQACWSWTRELTDVPTTPRAADTSILREATARLLASGRDSRFHAEVGQLDSALERLDGEPHPAAKALEGIISRFGRLRAEDPAAVYVATARRHVATLQKWLSEEDLDAEVRTISELREADVRDALILLGPPAHYLISPWCPADRAARIGSWLLNAPPARAVHVVTWPGHIGIDTRSGGLLPGSPPLRISRSETSAADDMAGSPDRIIWLPPAPVEAGIVVRTTPHDRDPVSAVGFRMAGDAVAFYSTNAGPRPELVSFDLDTVEITPTEPGRVPVGRVLMFRPERSAVDGELQRRADELLIAKRGAAAPAAAQAAKRELKEALRSCRIPHDQMVDELTIRVGDRHYASYVLWRLPDPDYIAPEKPGAYDAVRAVLGMGCDTGDRLRGLLGSLRGALRRAGITISAELVAVLKSTSGWQDELAATGAAAIVAGDLLGHLDLRVVTAVDAEPKTIGRSRLGRILPADGRR